MLKGERDHQLLSERPSCKLNALSPTPPLYVLVVPPTARTRPSVRPLFLNQQEYPVSAPTNEVHHGASSPIPSHHSIRGQRGFCLSVDSFPSLHSHPSPSPLSLSTDDAARSNDESIDTHAEFVAFSRGKLDDLLSSLLTWVD